MDMYDEFGNYIGPELDDGSDLDEYEQEEDFDEEQRFDDHEQALTSMANKEDDMDVDGNENRIILHEDKKYYPDASEVYPGVKTVVLDEDAQDITEPIIKPIKAKTFTVLLKDAPELVYDMDFLSVLLQTPILTRNIAILGHLHHGKTCFVDTLVQATHAEPWDVRRTIRYTDTRKDEQDRLISIKSTPVSLVLNDLKDKSYLINLIDTPGHTNFSDECSAAIRTVDGAVIVVDAVEGVMLSTERLIKDAVLNHLDLCLVINKVDRLILELKLPPQDAYYKLLHTIENVNQVINQYVLELDDKDVKEGMTADGVDGVKGSRRYTPQNAPRLSPELGNVCFASAEHNWSFSLLSFAEIYVNRYSHYSHIAPQDLGKRLWGDWYVNIQTNQITKAKGQKNLDTNLFVRSFVHFILEPLYKIYAHIVGESSEELGGIFRSLNIKLVGKEYHNDPRALLKLALLRFFGPPKGFVQMITDHLASPLQRAATIVNRFYTGPVSSPIVKDMKLCNKDGSLLAHVTKLYSTPDGQDFYALCRIYSGEISKGQRMKVLGEAFTLEDDEDMGVAEVGNIYIPMGRFYHEVSKAIAGNMVLIAGIDHLIKKTATLCGMEVEEASIFAPIVYNNKSVMKLAIEPLKPAELPKMIEGLRKVNKSYGLSMTKVEESGEHIVLGTGELYLDCIMADLRTLYTDIEIKVSDPVVVFNETVSESSIVNCVAETTNKKNSLTVIAEPLEPEVLQDIDNRYINLVDFNKQEVTKFFKDQHGYDTLTCHNIWAFGPSDYDANMLINNTLPSSINQKMLFNVKDSVVQGFKWGVREGPLCDEPMRGVKFRLLDAQLASEGIHRGGGQVIPAMRRTVYSSFLLAGPRILEPVYLTEIQAPADCVQAIYPVLSRRRGHVVGDTPKPGTPFYTIKAYIPAIDSFGFETDLRSYTLGQVFCQQVFDHWQVVPGDPLDKNVILHPLEPSPPLALARDFMVKTRRRKGLSEVSNDVYVRT
ncbi:GTP-binding protein [archaeon]|nr:MAG: GTP-binding protein [archaeon]